MIRQIKNADWYFLSGSLVHVNSYWKIQKGHKKSNFIILVVFDSRTASEE